MKKRILAMTLAIMAGLGMATASECQIHIGIAPAACGENVPQGVSTLLEGKLMRALSADGIMASGEAPQFFVAARFDDGYKEMLNTGLRPQWCVKTDLTLYVGDAENKTVYASCVVPLKGVGESEEQAYRKCLNSLGNNNREFRDFVAMARDKIVDYYNSNYKNVLMRARNCIQQRRYDEAMFYASQIPECCIGYEEACAVALEAYNHHTNYDAETLYAMAEAAWNADPSENGAQLALGYLAQIDPAAACKPQANALSQQIGKKIQRNWDYENRTKYENAVALEKMRIKSAENVAVAYAKSRPKVVNRYTWVYPSHYRY